MSAREAKGVGYKTTTRRQGCSGGEESRTRRQDVPDNPCAALSCREFWCCSHPNPASLAVGLAAAPPMSDRRYTANQRQASSATLSCGARSARPEWSRRLGDSLRAEIGVLLLSKAGGVCGLVRRRRAVCRHMTVFAPRFADNTSATVCCRAASWHASPDRQQDITAEAEAERPVACVGRSLGLLAQLRGAACVRVSRHRTTSLRANRSITLGPRTDSYIEYGKGVMRLFGPCFAGPVEPIV